MDELHRALWSSCGGVLFFAGFFLTGKPAWAVWAGYRRLSTSSGRAPSDYLRMLGAAPF